MGSSRPTDRSIGEATFLPQWMKGKLDTRFDYTESTFSPPADDNFFYIRFPNKEEATTLSNSSCTQGFKLKHTFFGNKIESNESTSSQLLFDDKNGKKYNNVPLLDFSKHLPSQQFISFQTKKVYEPKIIIANLLKSKQLADDFRNDKITENSCSIVHVANSIMSSKFGKASSSSDSKTFSDTQHHEVFKSELQHQKKGSKSLPVTPITSPNGTPDSSPKLRRRAYVERGRNGWLLSSILGQSRELITPKIAEENEQQMEQIPQHILTRKKSISSQNLIYFTSNDKLDDNNKQITQDSTHISLLQTKPSEFREMNFWSPTSM